MEYRPSSSEEESEEDIQVVKTDEEEYEEDDTFSELDIISKVSGFARRVPVDVAGWIKMRFFSY